MTATQWLDANRGGAATLAEAVSLATMVEPELLRAARLELCPGLGVEAESEVWFSPLVASRSPSGFIFSREALPEIWTGVRGDKPRLEQMLKLTKRFHAGLASTLEWEEEISYWALRDEPASVDRIQALLQQILKTMLSPNNPRMAVWAERALPRLPGAVRSSPAFSWVAQAAFERGSRLGAVQGVTSGPAWLKPSVTTTIIGVRLLGRAIEFSNPPAPGAGTASVPAGNAIRLLIADTPDFAAGRGFPRQITLTQNSTVREAIDLTPELYIRPAGGRSFVVSPALADDKPSIYLAAAVDARDAGLVDFIRSGLVPEFDVFAANAPGDENEIASRDVFLYICDRQGIKVPGEEVARAECRRMIDSLPPRPDSYEVEPGLSAVDFRDRSHWPAALNELKALLQVAVPRAGPIFDVPPLPRDYVQTPAVFEEARKALVEGRSQRILLEGVPGSGRSTLAAALARDCQVRHRFPNGIFWIHAGSAVVATGERRLFILDYTVRNLEFMQPRDGSVLLLTKSPSFKVEGQSIRIPSWSPEQVQAFAGSRPIDADVAIFTPLMARQFTYGDEEHRYTDLVAALRTLARDARIPASVVQRAWGGEAYDEVFRRLAEVGVLDLLADNAITVRQRDAEEPPEFPETDVHKRLVDSYEAECEGDWALGPNDGYYFQFLLYHMIGAGRRKDAAELLHDLDWLLAKWRNAGARLMKDDLALLPEQTDLSEVGSVVSVTGNDVQPVELARAVGTRQAAARDRFWERGASTWILVAGTSGSELGPELLFASEALGRELARAGYGLISGGWPGVDHVTCREYVLQLRRDETPSRRRLLHVVPEESRPDFWRETAFANEGDVDSAGNPQQSMIRSVSNAQAVVTIGGRSGVKEVLEIARSRRLPIFPIGSTGGESEQAATRSAPELRRPIRTRRDARELVKRLIDMLPPPIAQAAQA